MHMYPIDGAAHDVGPTDTAWSYRDANWGSVFAGVDPDPANVDAIRDWSVDYYEALHPYSAGGAYVNMMMDEGQERVRAELRRQLRPAGPGQGDLRPGQPVPRQPEHRAEGVGASERASGASAFQPPGGREAAGRCRFLVSEPFRATAGRAA